jgi:hypothetical protein
VVPAQVSGTIQGWGLEPHMWLLMFQAINGRPLAR